MDNNTNKILEEMISTPEGLDKLIEVAEKMEKNDKTMKNKNIRTEDKELFEEMISTNEGIDKLIEMMEQYKQIKKEEDHQENNKIVYDYTKLLKKINEKYNNSISNFNKDIEWDDGDIFKKLHGFSYFTMDEIDRIIKALGISSDEELEELFFTRKSNKKEVDSKALLEVSDRLFNVVTDLEILEEVDNKLAGPGGDERLAEIITFDYLKKAKKEAVEIYELLNKIGKFK